MISITSVSFAIDLRADIQLDYIQIHSTYSCISIQLLICPFDIGIEIVDAITALQQHVVRSIFRSTINSFHHSFSTTSSSTYSRASTPLSRRSQHHYRITQISYSIDIVVCFIIAFRLRYIVLYVTTQSVVDHSIDQTSHL